MVKAADIQMPDNESYSYGPIVSSNLASRISSKVSERRRRLLSGLRRLREVAA